MQSVSSRIWTRVALSISYDDNHSWRENNWIHTFPKGISAMWNAVGLVQDLNLCRRVIYIYIYRYYSVQLNQSWEYLFIH